MPPATGLGITGNINTWAGDPIRTLSQRLGPDPAPGQTISVDSQYVHEGLPGDENQASATPLPPFSIAKDAAVLGQDAAHVPAEPEFFVPIADKVSPPLPPAGPSKPFASEPTGTSIAKANQQGSVRVLSNEAMTSSVLPPPSLLRGARQTAYVAAPSSASASYSSSSSLADIPADTHRTSNLMPILDRLMTEKDQIQRKLMDSEKLNSHLYNANAMFHRKVKEMTSETDGLRARIAALEEELKESQSYKFLDEKAKLQKQLLENERQLLAKEQIIRERQDAIYQADRDIQQLKTELARQQTVGFDPALFIGIWQEATALYLVEYDNFGLNLERDRSGQLAIDTPPERLYGASFVMSHLYHYEQNTQWRRRETHMLTYQPATSQDGGRPEMLCGELICEFLLDGVPVAKGIYTVRCTRFHHHAGQK
jgi:hypothetical protein